MIFWIWKFTTESSGAYFLPFPSVSIRCEQHQKLPKKLVKQLTAWKIFSGLWSILHDESKNSSGMWASPLQRAHGGIISLVTLRKSTHFFALLENLYWIWKSFWRLAFPQSIHFSPRTSPPPSDLHDRSTWQCRWPCAGDTTTPKRVPWDHRGLWELWKCRQWDWGIVLKPTFPHQNQQIHVEQYTNSMTFYGKMQRFNHQHTQILPCTKPRNFMRWAEAKVLGTLWPKTARVENAWQ